MIQVSSGSGDTALAWRVRDALARHPLLGGATTDITIEVSSQIITLEGWVLDEGLSDLAQRLASRAAGRHPIRLRLLIRRGERGYRHSAPPHPIGALSTTRPRPRFGDEFAETV